MTQAYMIMPSQGSEQSDEWVRLGVEAQVAANSCPDKASRDGKLAEAQRSYQHSLRLDPRHAIAAQNLAIVYAQSSHLGEALLTIERAEMFDGHHSVIPMNFAMMLLEAEQIDRALEKARRAVELDPKSVPALLCLAGALTTAGKADEAVAVYEQVLVVEPEHNQAGANLCFIQTLTTARPEELLRARQRYHDVHCPQDFKPKPHANERGQDEKCWTCKGERELCPVCKGVDSEKCSSGCFGGKFPVRCQVCGSTGVVKMRPLRVGYVSGDFKTHSASFIFRRVALHHSADVEPWFYSCLPVDPAKDHVTKRFMEAAEKPVISPDPPIADTCVTVMITSPTQPIRKYPQAVISHGRWRDISQMSDEEADKLVRKDRIDILVDLAAHTNGGRLGLFMRKPAPIQVTAWGFAHGTGCPEVDYFFADPVAVPEHERQHFAEKVVDLPCIVTMEEPSEYGQLKATSMAPFKRNGFVTFGACARYEKMSDQCLKTYAEILRRVPDARLQFKDSGYRRPYSIKRVYAMMEDVDRDRLLFSINTSHPDHLLAYQQVDCCLDPFPHGGGVVSLEQLWMGLPLVTLYGTQAGARTASSVLTLMGRQGWVARSPEEYVDVAVRLAESPKELADARKTLRQELLDSPVVKGYVEAVEAKYRDLWKVWCDS